MLLTSYLAETWVISNGRSPLPRTESPASRTPWARVWSEYGQDRSDQVRSALGNARQPSARTSKTLSEQRGNGAAEHFWMLAAIKLARPGVATLPT
jgi:hypothetical protein